MYVCGWLGGSVHTFRLDIVKGFPPINSPPVFYFKNSAAILLSLLSSIVSFMLTGFLNVTVYLHHAHGFAAQDFPLSHPYAVNVQMQVFINIYYPFILSWFNSQMQMIIHILILSSLSLFNSQMQVLTNILIP